MQQQTILQPIVQIEPVADVSLIRRFKNRKLYDPDTSRYVSSKDVLNAAIVENRRFKVVDSGSGEDITMVVLMQALADRARKASKEEMIELFKKLTIYLSK